MTKKSLYQNLIVLIKYLTKLFDSISELASKLKWIGIAITFVFGISNYKACKDKDDAVSRCTKTSKERDSIRDVEKLIRRVGSVRADSIIKIKSLMSRPIKLK